MATGGFQRARQPAQKQQRREALLQAAATLLDEGGLEGVSLSAIARQAGLAKSNVYRYFDSREQILLELLAADEAVWVGQLELVLVPLTGSGDTEAVAAVVAQTLAAHPRLCLLSSVLASVLEQNISAETVLRFKTGTMGLAIRINNALLAALPQLDHTRAMALQRYVHALIAGLWPITHPAPLVAETLLRPELAGFRADFETDLRGALAAMLAGLCGGTKTGHHKA